jgi:hypothetical protein
MRRVNLENRLKKKNSIGSKKQSQHEAKLNELFLIESETESREMGKKGRSSKEEIKNQIQKVIRHTKEEGLRAMVELMEERLQNSENKWSSNARSLVILGELLEKCYIHSTDIEYSQFYMKELAIFAENFSQIYKEENPEVILSIREEAKSMFEKMEMKKSQYFKENAKEMSGSEQILRSLNLNLKKEKDNLESINYELKKKIGKMEKEMRLLRERGEEDGVKEAQIIQLQAEIEREKNVQLKEILRKKEKEEQTRKRILGLESECELLRRKLGEVKEERERVITDMQKEMEDMVTETEKIWSELREEKQLSERRVDNREMERVKEEMERRLIKKEKELEREIGKNRELGNENREMKRRIREKEEELVDMERNLEEVELKFRGINSKLRKNERDQERERRKELDLEQRAKEQEDYKNELLIEIEKKRRENIDIHETKNTEILTLKQKLSQFELLNNKLKAELQVKTNGMDDLEKIVSTKGRENQTLEEKLMVVSKDKSKLNQNVESLTLKNTKIEEELINLKEELNLKLNKVLKKLEESMEREKELSQQLILEREKGKKLGEKAENVDGLNGELKTLKAKASDLCDLLLKTKERVKDEEREVERLRKLLETEKETNQRLELKQKEAEKKRKLKNEAQFEWNLDGFYQNDYQMQKENFLKTKNNQLKQFVSKIQNPNKFKILPLVN